MNRKSQRHDPTNFLISICRFAGDCMGATALSRKSQVGVVQHNKSQNLLPVLVTFALKEGCRVALNRRNGDWLVRRLSDG
jgi:hypothetical protein